MNATLQLQACIQYCTQYRLYCTASPVLPHFFIHDVPEKRAHKGSLHFRLVVTLQRVARAFSAGFQFKSSNCERDGEVSALKTPFTRSTCFFFVFCFLFFVFFGVALWGSTRRAKSGVLSGIGTTTCDYRSPIANHEFTRSSRCD